MIGCYFPILVKSIIYSHAKSSSLVLSDHEQHLETPAVLVYDKKTLSPISTNTFEEVGLLLATVTWCWYGKRSIDLIWYAIKAV